MSEEMKMGKMLPTEHQEKTIFEIRLLNEEYLNLIKELNESLMKLTEKICDINISIDLVDEKYFFVKEEGPNATIFYLAIHEKNLKVLCQKTVYNKFEEEVYCFVNELEHEVQAELVYRLSKFLDVIAKNLQEKIDKYQNAIIKIRRASIYLCA